MSYTTMGRPHLLFKCMERQWVDLMYEKGQLRFSCPGKWVHGEKEYGRGQGDKFEGCFAIDRNGIDREKIFRKRYKKQLIVNEENGCKFYQLKHTLGTPTFCFYSLTDEHMQLPHNINSPGIYSVKTELSGQYFLDFARNRSQEEVELLDEKEKPALLIIMGYDNIRKFISRIKLAFKEQHNIDYNNIYYEQVKYAYNRDGEEDFLSARNHTPLELFYKGKEFEYQREGRIIINSKKYRFNDYLNDHLDISIGNMSDIAQVEYIYTPEGHDLIMTASVSEISEIQQRDGCVNEGYMGM